MGLFQKRYSTRLSTQCHQGTQSTICCKLNRSIYGLKQASRSWFNALLRSGFKQSKYDYSLFTKGEGDNFIAILVYVNDIILASPSQAMISKTKTILKDHFKLKDPRDLKFFLGLELSRPKEGIFMCQRHYTLSILEDCGMLACKPSSIPMEAHNKLIVNSRTKLADPGSYRRLVGRLLYLTISRLDICYCVHKFKSICLQPLYKPHACC